MRIAYISRAFLPSRTANSVHVMKMCAALTRLGHRVTLYAPAGGEREADASDPFRFYGIAERFEIRRIPWLKSPGRGLFFCALAALRARAGGSDLVYGRLLSGCFAASQLGLSVVYEAHEPATGGLARWMLARLVRHPTFRRLVVISGALRELMASTPGLSQALVEVAHDAADPPSGAVPRPLAGTGSLRVGYFGQLYPGRGVPLMLELAGRCRFADFHLVGGLEADLAGWRARAASLPNVFFHGFRPPSELDGYRASVDVLIAPYQRSVAVHGGPSDTSRWMSPLKIFEYMAAGRAIVASDHAVLQEVLTHERTALLCAPDEPDAWSAALGRLRDDAGLRTRLGEAAQREFVAHHTWLSRARRVLDGLASEDGALEGVR